MKLTQRTYSDLASVLAKDNAERAARREQARRERDADPEWQAIRRGRQEMIDRERAAKEAEKIEAEKHALVGWPAGLSAHIDRGSAKTKASFVRYLAQAVADYERDFPDQAPAPLVDVQQEAMDRRSAESRARARALEICTSKADLERLLALRPTDIGNEEAVARSAARHKLRLMADDPHGGEHHVEVQDALVPVPAVEVTDPEPVKRGRGRPPKFIAEQQYEITPDGALIED